MIIEKIRGKLYTPPFYITDEDGENIQGPFATFIDAQDKLEETSFRARATIIIGHELSIISWQQGF